MVIVSEHMDEPSRGEGVARPTASSHGNRYWHRGGRGGGWASREGRGGGGGRRGALLVTVDALMVVMFHYGACYLLTEGQGVAASRLRAASRSVKLDGGGRRHGVLSGRVCASDSQVTGCYRLN